MGIARSERIARWEGFELNVRTAELRRVNGKSVRLADKPFQILIALLERPGELLDREDLRKRLWPNDTVVEFEHAISAAMNRLRQALRDSAERPKFIETLARRGYRWKVPVTWGETPPAPVSTTPLAGSLIGKRVSHYRVLEILGGGGMGMVYKAEDLKLGRRVALKFLPEELAGDAAAMQRFEREARAASALNHPNICTIYAIEEHGGQPFLAMELLEGRSLRDFIADPVTGGELTLQIKPLLDIAIQVARGLEAAHQKGIIHRDIKPANIFVTNHDQVKILDFGLAKLYELESAETPPEACVEAEPEAESNPLLTLTRTGVAIGTAAYMSPEQIRGEKLDARTDLFSFGLVLYEMATGQRAFAGDTAPVLHNAILNQTPTPVRSLNPQIPARLEAVITKAIEKERPARYQTTVEIRADLEAAAPQVLRFGLFEVDLAASILRKENRRVDLQEQPFKILRMLLDRPGQLATREELYRALRPAGTLVELDQGLNTAVKKLRQALLDSADKPRYIETLGSRGQPFHRPHRGAGNTGSIACVTKEAHLDVGDSRSHSAVGCNFPIPASDRKETEHDQSGAIDQLSRATDNARFLP